MNRVEHRKDMYMGRTNPPRSRLAITVALALLCSVAASAQQVQVTLDPAQTKVNWVLGDVLHTVEGTFKLKSGSIVFDPKTGGARGQIVVDAKSGESGNDKRDAKMHKEVLESARYPEIVFLPKHVTGNLPTQGSATLQVQGVFRIHGGDHDMTLSFPVQADGSRATATTKFTVPYEAWGMKNPSVLFLKVENKVEVTISAVGTVSITAAASSATTRP
ncbi:MAG TPA: YceI family protein [Terriglobales bacterium]